jgi:hypothetical protein
MDIRKVDFESVEKDFKNTNKTLKQKDKQVYDLQKENSKIKEELASIQSDFSHFKAEINREAKQLERKRKKSEKKQFLNSLKSESEKSEFVCKSCDNAFSAEHELINHMISHHTSSTSAQTDSADCIDKKIQVKTVDFMKDKSSETSDNATIKFEIYSCFYCDNVIKSGDDLKEHVIKCCGPYLPIPSFQKVSKALPSASHPSYQSEIKAYPSQVPSFTNFNLPFGFPHLKTFPYPDLTLRNILPKCEHCGWTASSGTDLVNHKKRVHNDHRNPFEVYKNL